MFPIRTSEEILTYANSINQGMGIYFDRNDGQYAHIPPYGHDWCEWATVNGGFRMRIHELSRRLDV